jgi:hypothetical protein
MGLLVVGEATCNGITVPFVPQKILNEGTMNHEEQRKVLGGSIVVNYQTWTRGLMLTCEFLEKAPLMLIGLIVVIMGACSR